MAPTLFPVAGRILSKASRFTESASCLGPASSRPIERNFSSTATPSSPAFIRKNLPSRKPTPLTTTTTAGSTLHARGFKFNDPKPDVTPPLIPKVGPAKPSLLASILLRKPQFRDSPPLLFSKLLRNGYKNPTQPIPTPASEETIRTTQAAQTITPPQPPPTTPAQINPLVPPPSPPPQPPSEDYHYTDPPPPKSPWARLLLPTLFAVSSTIACYIYAVTYKPPPHDKRWFPQVSPEFATVTALIAANVVVFLLWQAPIGGAAGWRFMNKYMASIPGRPQWFSLLGSTFSHLRFVHLAVNCYALYVFGTTLCGELGRGNFLALYFSSGIVSALGSMVWNVYQRRWNVFSIGASGAITGLVGCYAYCFPDAQLYLMFLPFFSIGAWEALLGLGAFEILGMARGWMRLDHAAHLSGLLVGYVWAKTYLGDVVKRRREVLRRWYGKSW